MQLSLFESSRGVLDFMQLVLAEGAALAISISGGKDSDAMLRHLHKMQAKQRWTGDSFALFCELGRIEWPGVWSHIQRLCEEVQLPLVKLYPTRGMVEEWQRRYETIRSKQEDKPFWSSSAARYCTDREKTQVSNKFFRGSLQPTDKPFWSSSAARFCTKHEKIQPSDKLLRNYNFVVCAVGLRAEESSARAKKPRYQVRNDIASKPYKTPKECKDATEKEQWAEQAYQHWLNSGRKGRFALTWHPIHDWSIEQVWQQNGTSSEDVARRVALYKRGEIEQAIAGFPCHWAYTTGNSRLSCSMCVLASAADVSNGAQHNPLVWAELSLMELVGGWAFQQKRWLSSLSEEVMSVAVSDRIKLEKVLRQLNLVEPLTGSVMLQLLCLSPVEAVMLWQVETLETIAKFIEQAMVERESLAEAALRADDVKGLDL